MSVSPQSLARTRDKRSHKVPARFTDTVLGTLKDVPEMPTRASTRHKSASMGNKRDHEDEVEEKEEVMKVLKMAARPTAVSQKKQVKTTSNDEPTVTPVQPNMEQASTSSSSSQSSSLSTSSSSDVSTPPHCPNSPDPADCSNYQSTVQPATNPEVIKEQPINTSSNELISSLKRKPPASTVSNKKKSSKGISLIVRPTKSKDTNGANSYCKPPLTTRRTPNSSLSGVTNFNIHQTSNPIKPKTHTTPIVAKAPISTPVPPPAPTPQTTAQPTSVSQGRYFNNLTSNQQYGTRLLINEPIYLPRSVGTIAPITATLDQIASRARRSPFISKKAEACLAYQDQRKMNYITSNFEALVKITRYLGAMDRINLRCVNRTWQSVIDSSFVWKEVRLDKNDGCIDLDVFCYKYLEKHKTTDIAFIQYKPSLIAVLHHMLKLNVATRIVNSATRIVQKVPSLSHIFLKSTTSEENSIALDLLEGFRQGRGELEILERKLTCDWEIKVGIDSSGIATAAFYKFLLTKTQRFESIEPEEIHIELYDLKDKCENDLNLQVNIIPI